MKITLDHSVVKALLICAAKQDVRYYLKGVCVDARANGDVVLVTTDGHRMLAYPVATDAIEALAPGQYIIPREALEAVKPCKAGRVTLPITIEIVTAPDMPDETRPGVTIKGKTSITVTGATSAVTAPIDGTYPDWRRVLPAKATGELAQYSGHYMADFHTIAGLLSDSKSPMAPIVHHNGTGFTLVTRLGAGALGVIMPVRYDIEDMAHPGLPAWALV